MRPIASIEGERLVFNNHIVTGPDVIDLLHLGKPVPVYCFGEPVGTAEHNGKRIRVRISGRSAVFKLKYLLLLAEGEITGVRGKWAI